MLENTLKLSRPYNSFDGGHFKRMGFDIPLESLDSFEQLSTVGFGFSTIPSRPTKF